MPFPKQQQKVVRKKPQPFWTEASRKSTGFGRKIGRNLEDIVTGFPTGVVATAEAIDRALPRSPIPGVDDKHKRDATQIKNIGKMTLKQMQEDLRHPLRNPVSTALTVAGILSLGTGAAARGAAGVSAASKGAGLRGAAKAAARPKPAVRTLRGIQKPAPVTGGRYKSASGKWVEKAPPRTGRKDYKLVANKNPLVRGARKITLDKLYERSAAKAAKNAKNPRLIEGAKVLKHGSKEYEKVIGNARTTAGILRKASMAGYAAIQRGDRIQPVNKAVLHPKQPRGGGYARFVERRTVDQRERYAKQLRSAINPPDDKPVVNSLPRNLVRTPLDLMRLSMYVRPRYYVQNLGGTATLLAHMGASAGDVRAVRQIAKSDPELYRMMIGAGGETATSSISFGTTGGGVIGRTQQKAAHIANRPEAHMRTVAVYKAAKDFGIESPAQLKAILSKPDSNKAQLIMQRANEAVVDYSRVGGSSNFGKMEEGFVRSGLPIFYPMTKGFTRYAGRFPSEHPAQAGVLAALGQQGKELQRQGIGGEPQPWFPYITPTGPDSTINLQNIYAFSPGADVIRQAAQALPTAERHPTLNLLQQLGPFVEFVTGGTSGRQLATGFEYDEDTLSQRGSLLTALSDTANSVIPFADLVRPRSSAAFGSPSPEERFRLWALGPGFVERKTDMSRVRQPNKGKRRRKKTNSGY